LCPYCDETLNMDTKFCSFCKENLTFVLPKPDKLNFYGMLIDIHKTIAAKRKHINYGCFWVVVFIFMTLVISFFTVDIFSYLFQ
jgi:hypothetical protein